MIELTEAQHQAQEQNGQQELRVLDPADKAEYVLVRAEVYGRLKAVLCDDWTDGAYQASMEVFAKEGWDDPRMDVYDELDPRRNP